MAVVLQKTYFFFTSEIARREVEKYKSIPQTTMSDDPLLFLAKRELEFPNLTVLAEQYFCVQASSVASERVFSTTGDIVSATRACLKPEHVDALVFLKKNARFQLKIPKKIKMS